MAGAKKEKIDLTSLDIIPLNDKKLLKGVFPNADKEFQNLINWLKTFAVLDQREKKSKTYLARYQNQIIAYLTVSTGFLEGEIKNVKNTSSFSHQVLMLGKLYVIPEYRGNGIGVKLLNFVVDIANDINEMTGCLGIQVDSNENKKTVDFYKKFGFVEFDEDNDGERTIRMIFKLPPSSLD